jgi:hypothetical protein
VIAQAAGEQTNSEAAQTVVEQTRSGAAQNRHLQLPLQIFMSEKIFGR